MRCAVRVLVVSLFCLLGAAPPARAQSPEPGPAPAQPQPPDEPTQQQPPDEPTHQALPPASKFRDLPKADQAGGVERAEARPYSPLRALARVVLFVPKWVFYGLTWPIRQGLYVNDKYSIASRIKLVFFNDEETFGIYPVALFETGFGLNIGARLFHKDLLGKGERLRLRASYGGVYRQLYRASLSSGERLRRTRLSLETDYSIEPDANFYGIGNGDIDPFPTPGIDPYERDDVATRTRLRQERFRVELRAVFDLSRRWPELTLATSVAYRSRNFDSTDEGVPLEGVFDPAAVVGVQSGLSSLYGELELTYDGHRNSRHAQWGDATGTRASVFVGYAKGLADDPSNFVRYGADISRLFDLYDGNRVLVLRGYVEGVTADRRDVPFIDLPVLGGRRLLRGYDRSRFRDTIAAFASLEYEFALQRNAWAYLFTDIGRVYPRWSAVTAKDLRIGYGGGIQIQSPSSFVGRVQVASSQEGRVFFSLLFSPALSAKRRTKR